MILNASAVAGAVLVILFCARVALEASGRWPVTPIGGRRWCALAVVGFLMIAVPAGIAAWESCL